MEHAQAQEFRQLLEQERATLASHLRQLRAGSVPPPPPPLLDGLLRTEDASAQAPGADGGYGLDMEEHEIAALSQVDAALKRLAAGVYGECMECGLAIDLALLRATPHALRCAPCEEAFQRGGGRSTY